MTCADCGVPTGSGTRYCRTCEQARRGDGLIGDPPEEDGEDDVATDGGDGYRCPYCGEISEDSYRCSECRKDLTDDNPDPVDLGVTE